MRPARRTDAVVDPRLFDFVGVGDRRRCGLAADQDGGALRLRVASFGLLRQQSSATRTTYRKTGAVDTDLTAFADALKVWRLAAMIGANRETRLARVHAAAVGVAPHKRRQTTARAIGALLRAHNGTTREARCAFVSEQRWRDLRRASQNKQQKLTARGATQSLSHSACKLDSTFKNKNKTEANRIVILLIGVFCAFVFIRLCIPPRLCVLDDCLRDDQQTKRGATNQHIDSQRNKRSQDALDRPPLGDALQNTGAPE